jgi:hypothetical protein
MIAVDLVFIERNSALALDFFRNLLRLANTALRGAHNPHVLKYIPVAALRAPCLHDARYGFESSLLYKKTKLFARFYWPG